MAPDIIRSIRQLGALSPLHATGTLAALAVCYALTQAALLAPVYVLPLNGTWVRTAEINLSQTALVLLSLLIAYAALRSTARAALTFISLQRPLRLGNLAFSFVLTLLAIALGEIFIRGALWEEISWRWLWAAIALIPVSILQGGQEEIIYRGLLLAFLYGIALVVARMLRSRASGPAARVALGVVVLAADAWIFAWWHGAQTAETWVSHISIGLTAGLLLWITGRLEDAIGYHAANNYCLLIVAGPLILQRGFTGVSQLFQLFSDRERLSQTFLFYAVTSSGIIAVRFAARRFRERQRSSPPPGYPLPADTRHDLPRAES